MKRHVPPVRDSDDRRIEDLRLLARAGRGPTEAARYLGVNICTIRRWAKIGGIQFGALGSYMRTHWTPEYRVKFLANRWGASQRAAAAERMRGRHKDGTTGRRIGASG